MSEGRNGVGERTKNMNADFLRRTSYCIGSYDYEYGCVFEMR